MKVKLTYFKENGTFYASIKTNLSVPKDMSMTQIWGYILALRDTKRLPGLIPDHSDYHIVIDVPDHEHNHPHLIPIGD